jgi:hypothetical protein
MNAKVEFRSLKVMLQLGSDLPIASIKSLCINQLGHVFVGTGRMAFSDINKFLFAFTEKGNT